MGGRSALVVADLDAQSACVIANVVAGDGERRGGVRASR
jgi:hypothetical protein